MLTVTNKSSSVGIRLNLSFEHSVTVMNTPPHTAVVPTSSSGILSAPLLFSISIHLSLPISLQLWDHCDLSVLFSLAFSLTRYLFSSLSLSVSGNLSNQPRQKKSLGCRTHTHKNTPSLSHTHTIHSRSKAPANASQHYYSARS